jgi:hypothetical protein
VTAGDCDTHPVISNMQSTAVVNAGNGHNRKSGVPDMGEVLFIDFIQ